jgi:hypothetical protein
MYRLINYIDKYNRLFILAVLFIIIHYILHIYSGLVTDKEAIKYISIIDELKLNEYNFLNKLYHLKPQYLFYSTLIFLHIILKDVFLIFLLQIFLNFISTICFYKLCSKIFKSDQVAFFSTLFLILFFPYQQTTHWLYTESIFCSLSFMLFYTLFSYKGVKKILASGFFLFLLIMTRPTGLLYLVILSAYFLLIKSDEFPSKSIWQKYNWLILPLTLFIILPFIFFHFANNNIVFNYKLPSNPELDVLRPVRDQNVILGLKNIWGKENSVSPELELIEENSLYAYMYYIVNNPLNFIKLALLRVFSFFIFLRPYYSFAHNAVLLLLVLPVYFSFVNSFKKLRSMNKRLLYYSLITIAVTCMATAVSFDEWNSRFTLPIVPLILFPCGYYFSKNYNKYFKKRIVQI